MLGSRLRLTRPPFKYWWQAGGLLVVGLLLAGWWNRWSGDFLAATAIVAGIYVGLPPMEQARRELLPRGGTPAPTKEKRAANAKGPGSGGAMAWDTQINPVIHALSSTISDSEIIRDIAMKSGLSMHYVRNAPDAESYWTAVFERAQDEGRERVDSIFDEALIRTQSLTVRDSIESYRRARDKQ